MNMRELAEQQDSLLQLVELTSGVRAQYIANGFSDEAAEEATLMILSNMLDV